MCGITGIWSERHAGNTDIESIVRSMNDQLAHRGPDGSGTWVDPELGLAFGHRRLSILDVSELGAQPMTSHSGRFVLSYNGEVYNFRELRKQLPGIQWRGGSDTEVFLEAFERWGIEQTVDRLNGMFAISLWDRQERKLWLVRDRIGIKPLYYYHHDGQLAFASELSSFDFLPGFMTELDPAAVRSLIARGNVAAPLSIFKHVKKLEPGCILEFSSPAAEPKMTCYWSFEATAEASLQDPIGDGDPVSLLEEELRKSVELRMISDVPLGAFLSGGIDSSLVVSLMQAQSESPVKTFSIGFEEQEFDESPFARKVAQHLGTDHTELIVRSSDALEILPNLASYYDEPFADQSLIPTMMVSRLAREQVTVSLSGDGGDELFGGYSRYFRTLKRWRKFGQYPKFMGDTIGHQWIKSRQSGKSRLAALMGRVRADQADRFFRYTTAPDLATHYERSIDANCIGVIDHNFLEPANFARPFSSIASKFDDSQQIMRLMLIDSVTYLPNDILTKVDRASMRYSLEARVPILDHNVVSFAFRLNDSHRISNGSGKLILKQLLERYVPRELFDRKKKGFGVPIGQWMRSELRDWSESLLGEPALREVGFFDVPSVSAMWQDHLKGHNQWFARLWRVLVFQNWYQAFKNKQLPPIRRSLS